jgi:hypothetical protein
MAMTANPSNLDTVQADFQRAKNAFDRGAYRESVEGFERILPLVDPNSVLGGEVQIWLVTAYQAKGQMKDAIALCKQLTNHPNLRTRKEGKRILYILEAPKLKSRPEWLTEIPDLTGLSDSETRNFIPNGTAKISVKRVEPKPKPVFEPVDRSQVNTKDNQFVWVALAAVLIGLGSLLWIGWRA